MEKESRFFRIYRDDGGADRRRLNLSYQFHSPTISPSPSPSSTPPLPSSSTSSTWDRACLCSPSVAELVARDWGGGDGEELRVLVGDLGWDSRSLWIFRCRR
ncbi:hypothetical protein BHM03_00061032 [Ensete ventricosum]|nr:hypothetical protein BHM03_00061032 [Ensete ventricosum]